MIAILRNLIGGLLFLVAFSSAIYLTIYYSPNPDSVGGVETASSSEKFSDADWEATWEWSTAKRINKAYAVLIVTYEKSWLGYHTAIVSEVLKPSGGSDLFPAPGSEFKYASFHKTDSKDYGDGALYLFYDESSPIREQYFHFASGVLRDDDATTLTRIRSIVARSSE